MIVWVCTFKYIYEYMCISSTSFTDIESFTDHLYIISMHTHTHTHIHTYTHASTHARAHTHIHIHTHTHTHTWPASSRRLSSISSLRIWSVRRCCAECRTSCARCVSRMGTARALVWRRAISSDLASMASRSQPPWQGQCPPSLSLTSPRPLL
jgi:hypothetical protein